MNNEPVSFAEKQKIIRLRRYLSVEQVAFIMNRSEATISRATQDVTLADRALETNKALYKWLQEHWCWKAPADQPALTLPGKPRKKRKHTQFRTPYSYPRLWDQERRSN